MLDGLGLCREGVETGAREERESPGLCAPRAGCRLMGRPLSAPLSSCSGLRTSSWGGGSLLCSWALVPRVPT